MKYLKRINDSFTPVDDKSFTGDQSVDEIYINKKNSPNRNDQDTRMSIYLEDGQLKPAKFIICHDLDMEGRYRTGVLGIYKIKPEYFDVHLNKTADGQKTYYKYRLNKTGWDALSALGKCSQTFDLVDEEYIQNLIRQNEMSIQNLQRDVEKYKALLGE